MKQRRRSFIRNLGLSAAAAATVPLMRFASTGRAQTGGPPRRLVIFHGGSGSLPGLWEPRGVGGGAATETSWALNDLHHHLAGFESDLLILENLHMQSDAVDPTGGANAHLAGATHALSATNRATGSLPGGPSIDQFIAQQINAGTPLTLRPSVYLLATSWYNGDLVSYPQVSSGAGELVAPIWEPGRAYDYLFPPELVSPDPVMTGPNPRTVQRAEVLDFVRGRYGELASRLSATDRMRLEQHEDGLSSLRARLDLTPGGSGGIPDRTILGDSESIRFAYDADHTPYWQATSEIHPHLVAAALHADITRVVTLAVDEPPGSLVGYADGDFGTMDLHDLVHKVTNPADALSSNTEARTIIRNWHDGVMATFRALLDDLADRIESDGSRLLDNTTVLYCSHIADGSHSLQNLPWFLAGSCGGAFRTGRYVRSSSAIAHNDLFVSLANAMGVETNTFGNPAVCRGPMTGLT